MLNIFNKLKKYFRQRFTDKSKEEIFNNIPEIPDSDDLTETFSDQIAAAPK